jgi:hypothetical protein
MPSSAAGPLLNSGADLEHDAILVGLREDRRDERWPNALYSALSIAPA